MDSNLNGARPLFPLGVVLCHCNLYNELLRDIFLRANYVDKNARRYVSRYKQVLKQYKIKVRLIR